MVQRWIAQLLESHNRLRLWYKSRALSLNNELAQLAQTWANELAERDSLQHDPSCHSAGLGENLFARTLNGADITGQEVSEHWHSEVEHYNWSRVDGQILCCNFTQLVWRSTTEVGFGRAVSRTGRLYVVARYWPAGNWPGGFDFNVQLPRNMEHLVAGSSTQISSLVNQSSSSAKQTNVLLLANTLNSNVTARRFAKDMLIAHNEYRVLHQAQPLRINDELTRQAQVWADTLASKDTLTYDNKCDRLGIGENIARKCGIQQAETHAQEFVDSWYSEVIHFNWRSLEDQLDCSHFAQLVWRASREAGFGRAVSASGCIYVVGRYLPRGNNTGEFPRNVLPRIVKRSNTVERNHSIEYDATNTKHFRNMLNNLLPISQMHMEQTHSSPKQPIWRHSSSGSLTNVPKKRGSTGGPLDAHSYESRSDSTSTATKIRAKAPLSCQTAPRDISPPPGRNHRSGSQDRHSSPSDVENTNIRTPSLPTKSLFGVLAARHTSESLVQSSVTSRGLFMTMAKKSDGPLQHFSRPLAENDDDLVPTFKMSRFLKQLLVSHNEYRAQHKAPPLRLNMELCRMAQEWADVLAMRDRMAHDPTCAAMNTGENVAMKFKIGETNFPGDVFTDLWYDESESYDWNSHAEQLECGHFTQLVWKGTTEVGFGRAVSDSGRVYVVGRYRPPGNYAGGYKRNVIPTDDDQAAQQKQQPSPTETETTAPLQPAVEIGAQPLSLREFLSGKSAAAKTDPMAALDASPLLTKPASPFSAMMLQSTIKQAQTGRTKTKDSHTEEEKFSHRKFETQLLVSHNEYRALHRSPPLRMSVELAKLAQAWAEVLAVKDKMAHDPQCSSLELGENVAMKMRKGYTKFSGDLFTEIWYNEIEQYKWNGEDQPACGHFTQLVWRSSTEVGFGRAVSKTGRVYVVARYKPPGNYSGQFSRNVLPPSRVMPKSRSNSEAKEPAVKQKTGGPQPDDPLGPSRAPEQPPSVAAVEYAGFGTARVVDYNTYRGLTVSARVFRPPPPPGQATSPASKALLNKQLPGQKQLRGKDDKKQEKVQKDGS